MRCKTGRRALAPVLRPGALAASLCTAVVAATGCSALSDALDTNKVDYRAASAKTATLEVPPDLTQLSNDPRYQPPSGAPVSANAVQAAGTAPLAGAAPAASAVAPAAVADMRIERDGSQRWLVTPLAPEALWPRLREFWAGYGFELIEDRPEFGVMQTGWKENRARLPQDFIRRTLGRVIDGMYDSGERDRYRTRIERTARGTEVYISHAGAQEVVSSAGREDVRTTWQMRPSSPDLEAEMLARLMVKLATPEGVALPASAAAASVQTAVGQVNAVPAAPARARLLGGGTGPALQLDDDFDRAWRRVGSALDRSSFTVEDRDRSQGTYFVRYVDPKLAGQEDPGFFSRLFGGQKKDLAGTRYRVVVRAAGTGSVVGVQSDAGAPLNDDNARNIVQLLLNELR